MCGYHEMIKEKSYAFLSLCGGVRCYGLHAVIGWGCVFFRGVRIQVIAGGGLTVFVELFFVLLHEIWGGGFAGNV